METKRKQDKTQFENLKKKRIKKYYGLFSRQISFDIDLLRDSTGAFCVRVKGTKAMVLAQN